MYQRELPPITPGEIEALLAKAAGDIHPITDLQELTDKLTNQSGIGATLIMRLLLQKDVFTAIIREGFHRDSFGTQFYVSSLIMESYLRQEGNNFGLDPDAIEATLGACRDGRILTIPLRRQG